MSLLISPHRDAQEKILQGLTQALTELSPKAIKCLKLKLEQLAFSNNSDVVICGYNNNPGQPEFNLAWYKREDDSSQYQHPHENGQRPYMVGGLIFHSFNDSWGIHT